MSWGPYWMYYECPACGKKFRSTAEDLADPAFGVCPDCQIAGTFRGESKALPPDDASYEIVEF